VSRIVLAWELGSHLGHVSRLLPLAKRLQARGHHVLVAARDLALASRILGADGIAFIQAPFTWRMAGLSRQPAGFADLLFQQGWSDPGELWALVRAWCNLFALCGADAVVLDYAPTALFAAKILRLPSTAIGTGFELPPATCPLPLFPGFSGATVAEAAQVETRVLGNVNRVRAAHRLAPIESLFEMLEPDRKYFTTFPELDHYGPRASGRYVGPINEIRGGETIEWPGAPGRRIFAYLRPTTPCLPSVIHALADTGAAVVCYAPGISSDSLQSLQGPRCRLSPRPVDIAALLPEMDVCVSYSPAGTVTAALLSGVPQLLLPAHIEAQLTAHRVEVIGAGLVLRGPQTPTSISAALQALQTRGEFKLHARSFGQKYCQFNAGKSADEIVGGIESMAA
jgi:UDP:flavonoid glycosyltransferase YjiC (YdhE family)